MEKPKTLFVETFDLKIHCFEDPLSAWEDKPFAPCIAYVREDIAVKAMELLMEQSFCTTLTKEDILQSFSEAFQNQNQKS